MGIPRFKVSYNKNFSISLRPVRDWRQFSGFAHLANREARGSSAIQRKPTESRRARLLHQQASVCAASCRSRLQGGIGPFLGSGVCFQLLYCAARRWRVSCPQLAHSLLPELLLLNVAYHVQEQRPAVCLPRQRRRRRPRRPRLRARP